MDQKLKTIFDFIQQNENLSADEKVKFSKTIKDVDKELAITTFKLDRTEKVKRTTAILLEETIEELEQKRKAVEAQNRELEIETSLERVRTVAMGMRKPNDLLGICEILFTELRILGFGELRNAMINIHDDDKGSFLNYDFSEAAGKTVTTIFYNSHPATENLVKQVRSANDAFAGFVITSDDLSAWRDYRKKMGEPDDPRLDNVSALSYYFYSIGAGAIGISTYSPVTEEKRNVLKRFRNAFDLAYQRYTDIIKAEAQAREAQIELALERVRACAMAMQQSADLGRLIFVLYQELTKLDAQLDRCFLMIVNPENNGITWWMAGQEGLLAENGFFVQMNQHASHLMYLDYCKQRKKKWTYLFKGKEKRDWDRYGFSKTELTRLPEPVKAFMAAAKQVHLSGSSDQFGSLVTGSFEPLPEEQQEIISRFSIAFNQAYIRFLDLQNAETQAREAQIEAALEKVRSRSMAMQNSNELKEVVKVVFGKMKELGFFQNNSVMIVLPKNGFKDTLHWTFNENFETTEYFIPAFNHQVSTGAYNTWKSGNRIFEINLDKVEKDKFLDLIFTETDYSKVPDEFKKYLYSTDAYSQILAFEEHCGLLVDTFSTVTYTTSQKDVIIRFARVFEQAYTRFLDLQKAEAQAREAQIEASFEKVRSSAMAMHNSNDISATTSVIFTELHKLGIESLRCGIGLLSKKSRVAVVYAATTSSGGEIHTINTTRDMTEHSSLIQQYESWLKQESLATVLSGEELKSYYQHAFFNSSTSRVPPEGSDWKEHGYYIPFTEGLFYSWTERPYSENEVNILNRFKTIIELTFRRFFDLQRAEAQTREAQIEAALERVRSKAMAMHSSEDLNATIGAFYRELEQFSITPRRCGVGLLYKETRIAELSTMNTLEHGNSIEVIGKLLMSGHWVLDGVYDNWCLQKEYHPVLRGNEIKEYNQLLRPQVAFPEYPNGSEQFGYFFFFPEGGVYAWTEKEMKEDELIIYRRFTTVLSLTYKRYKDLKDAEANAREAQIEAALERVRSKTMAMHNSADVGESVAALFDELLTLGVLSANDRCGIGLMQPDEMMEAWTAAKTVEGKAELTIGYLNMAVHPLLKAAYDGWKTSKETNQYILKGDDKLNYYEAIRNQSGYKIKRDYFSGVERIVHTDFYFTEGCLYVFSSNEFTSGSAKIFIRFTNVFGQTYRRYLDLQKAEAQAKEAIKASSLDRVRAEIASMRTVDDLQRITPLIWYELLALGVPFVRCGVFIMVETTAHVQVHLSAPDGHSLGLLNLPFNSSELTVNTVNHWRNGIIFKTHWNKEEFLTFMQTMIQEGQVKNPETYQGASAPPESLYLHFVPFKQGMLYVGNSSPLEINELQLVKSLAESFSIAYARYEDFRQLEEAKNKIEITLAELKATQSQLIQSEKMASLGELTAGIAHEIQNPLNFVNNFSDVSKELIGEMNDELAVGNWQLAKEIATDIGQNLEKINHHGKRAADIVKGMLQHSRTSSGQKEPTDINALADEYLRLAYHGLRAKDKSFNAEFKTEFDETLPKVNVIPQDIGRVLLNLINNAFYAAPLPPEGGFKDPNHIHKPIVIVKTSYLPPSGGMRGACLVRVSDNGPGIPSSILDKIFQPFFTTKPTGQGTGLGLSLSYDIVKAHGGDISVESKEGKGSQFIIQLPIN